MLTKSAPFEFKKLDESGTFEALVAVFNNVDKGGDRIKPGAFAKTLAQWKASGDPIPVIFNHDWADANAHIGVVESAEETMKGLMVKGRLDIADNPVARQVHRLMERRSLKEFSFGYSVPSGGERRAKDGAIDLLEIDLAEVGPTLKGMNPATELHAVKSALGVKEEPLSAADLRKESERLERELADAALPEVKAAEPAPDLILDLSARLAEVTERLERAEKALEEKPDPAELRRESERIAREIQEAQLPEVKTTTPVEREPDQDLAKELQEVKALLTDAVSQIADLKEKAEETDKEPKARSVDPLRRRSEELALELSSGGMSLSRPPKQDPPPPCEAPSLAALKRQSRDLMEAVLSYDTE